MFETEVGVVYHKTREARLAPLRRVDLAAARPPGLAKLTGIRYTPTFVLMDRGREVGRILGYPGEAHFWGQLGRLLEELPSRKVPDAKLLDLTTEFQDDGRNEVDAPS